MEKSFVRKCFSEEKTNLSRKNASLARKKRYQRIVPNCGLWEHKFKWLSATDAGRPVYERLGFAPGGAYTEMSLKLWSPS